MIFAVPLCLLMAFVRIASIIQCHRPRLSGQRAVSLYQEPLRGCIHSLKYDGNIRLAVPLGLLLAQAYRRYGMQADILIPVPLHSEPTKLPIDLGTRAVGGANTGSR